MISVKEDTTIIGVSEFRRMVPQILEKMKKEKIILTRRNRPVGILLDYDEYEKMEELIDAVEDHILGQLAKERASRRGKKVIDLDEAEQRVGL